MRRYVLNAEGDQRHANDQQVQKVEVVSTKRPFMQKGSERCHLDRRQRERRLGGKTVVTSHFISASSSTVLTVGCRKRMFSETYSVSSHGNANFKTQLRRHHANLHVVDPHT